VRHEAGFDIWRFFVTLNAGHNATLVVWASRSNTFRMVMVTTTQKQRVLIVDDQKANLKILSDMLRPEVDIVLAQDGEQGFRKACELRPDLILLDVLMPGIDGFEVIRRLKHEAVTSAIPVIFITALNDVSHEEQGLLLGACDYINKPFHSVIVKARIQLHLQLARQRLLLEQLAHLDPLTAIANRRKFEQVLLQEWRGAMRSQRPISLVMLDIDNFKLFNDQFGHAAGDRALQQVASTLNQQLKRPFDFIARYGGEEFVLVLPDTPALAGQQLVQQCLQAVLALQIPHLPANEVLSLSAGGITFLPGQQDLAEQALAGADQMLYQAKHQGKNRVLWTGSNQNGDC
jgi:diguanylate cyclase (GGDEF)-like protein